MTPYIMGNVGSRVRVLSDVDRYRDEFKFSCYFLLELSLTSLQLIKTSVELEVWTLCEL